MRTAMRILLLFIKEYRGELRILYEMLNVWDEIVFHL